MSKKDKAEKVKKKTKKTVKKDLNKMEQLKIFAMKHKKYLAIAGTFLFIALFFCC